jgi:hypothetical protein
MRRLLPLCSLILLLALWPAQGWGGVLATDDFNRADAGLGANWTTVTGADQPDIESQLVVEGTLGGAAARALYTALTFPNDQYASIKVVTAATSTARAVGVILRGVTSALTHYELQVLGPLGATTTISLFRFNSGTPTQLATTGASYTVASGDILKLRVIGSTLTAFLNGTQVFSYVDGSPISSGTPGIFVTANGNAVAEAQLDNWEGGDTTTATSLGSMEVDE